MPAVSALRNRLIKNARHWGKWARRQGIGSYRLYDRDIPEFPLAVDRYEGRVHVQEFARRGTEGKDTDWWAAVLPVVAEVLEVPPEAIATKQRRRQKGSDQYNKTGETGKDFVVHEDGLAFWVNMDTYLDTGLFLDHRPTRHRIRQEAAGKRFLNLFAYTGSFSVYAAAGGASHSLTVDLSNTYQDWTRRNFALNEVDLRQHHLLRTDVLRLLDDPGGDLGRFDLIVMDPPSFSNSKAMAAVLDVQRDHPRLIAGALDLLAPGGTLYFSNNRQGFQLDENALPDCQWKEITTQTLAEDFRRKGGHRCWLIQR
ncbi:MAG: class I SAM-dependent methyltransferase [Chromatiales bacterium]|nr:class I SAM-dependent methyltransferase [Chromatiales bacterium]